MANQNEVLVTIKSVYGEEKIYPHCAKAAVFASIAGTKTLTGLTVKRIQSLGYKVLYTNGGFNQERVVDGAHMDMYFGDGRVGV